MRSQLEQGLRAGITWGLIHIFLVLIGFPFIMAELLGELLGNLDVEGYILGFRPLVFDLLIFTGLLGIWGGANGAKKPEEGRPDLWAGALAGGALAGLLAWLIQLPLMGLLNTWRVTEVDPRTYLSALSPEVMDLYLQQEVFGFAVFNYAILFVVTGLLGGLIARGIGRGAWRQSVSAWWQGRRDAINQHAGVEKVRRSRVTRIFLFVLLLGFLLWYPQQLNDYWAFVLGSVGIFALMALGLNIEVGYAGLLDLGIVAFFAVGAYTVALLTSPDINNIAWSFWVALPLGVLLAGLFGVLLGIPVLRLRGDYLAIVTLGLGEIIRVLIRSDLLTDFLGGPRGVRNISGPVIFGESFASNQDFLYLIMLGVALTIFITIRLRDSRVGRAMIAIREDETVAQAMGINTLKYKLMAFGIGAAFAGMGGVIFAARNQFTGPEDHTLLISINVLSVVIVGGMGSIPGVITGAFALRGLPEVLRELESYRTLAFGALLVVMMIVRPEGLWPSKRRRLEFADDEEIRALSVEDDEEPPPDPDLETSLSDEDEA
jgi:ABC-type branched-subunit amino acid transport system permease subunit